MPWVGNCNQCGLCCTRYADGMAVRCEHLRILGPELTICDRHPDRVDGMPVRLVNAIGELVQWSVCDPTYPDKMPADFPLPGPCSYRWEDHPRPST